MPPPVDGVDPESPGSTPSAFVSVPGCDADPTATLVRVTEQPTLTCSLCGTVAADPQPTWMLEHDPARGSQWFCGSCTREHLRAIESRLSREWW